MSFPFSTFSRPALGPFQPPIQWILGRCPRGVKQLAHETDRSPPSSDEVKNCGVIPPLPCRSSWCGAYLIKHTNNFTFFRLWVRLQYSKLNWHSSISWRIRTTASWGSATGTVTRIWAEWSRNRGSILRRDKTISLLHSGQTSSGVLPSS
jgi:hypothetical protein